MFLSRVIVLMEAHPLVVCRQCPFFTDTDGSLPVLLCFSRSGFHSLHAVIFLFR